MSSAEPNDDWLNRAFQLAYFIHADKAIASDIATAAISKLDIAAAAQDKRLSYAPSGGPSSRKSRTKISLSELHLLQRLVYIESEPYEKQKEQHGTIRESDMLVHFIKHLVRITVKRNAFYVTLAIARLLHNYTTAEAQEIYGAVMQDPDRVSDDHYFRARKACLMTEIKNRFGSTLATSRGRRGEERFQSDEQSERHTWLVNKCLELFTPWSTLCIWPESAGPFNQHVQALSFNGDDPDEEHTVEVNRIHTLLHPLCLVRLIRAIGFDSPELRLQVPIFLNAARGGGGGNQRDEPPKLSQNELETLRAVLAEQAARRRAVSAGLLRIVVDGTERARLDTRRMSQVSIELDDNDELVEVIGKDKHGPLLMSAYLVSGVSEEEHQTECAVVLEGGQRLSFAVRPPEPPATSLIFLEIEYRETNRVRAASLALRRVLFVAVNAAPLRGSEISPRLRVAFAVVALLLVAAAIFFVARPGNKEEQEFRANREPSNLETPNRESGFPPKNETPAPEDHNSPSPEPGNRNALPVPRRTVPHEQPRSEERFARDNRDNESPARAPEEPGNVSPTDPTRSPNPRPSGVALSQVKTIHIQITGDDALSSQFRNSLAGAIRSSGVVSVNDQLAGSDAQLKVSVRSADQLGVTNRSRVIVTARLANVAGEVIWPAPTSGASYQGTIAETTASIARDLAERIQKSRQPR
jgi:lipopolysaccharide assembly LptE-like protein